VDQVLLFALLAALNPTLVAASTLMMLLPRPVRLLTSVTLGLVIVFSFEGSSTVTTTQHTLSPIATIALGAIALWAAIVVKRGEDGRGGVHRSRRREAKPDKGPPRWQRALSRGSPRITFLVGALLTLPGASYLAGLSHIDKLNYATAPTVALIIAFNLVMMSLLEVPLVLFLVAPHWTPRAIERGKGWVTRHAHRFILVVLTVVGTLLVIKGVVELVA
jgi:Sap, sulfolipid-1-addressing protein